MTAAASSEKSGEQKANSANPASIEKSDEQKAKSASQLNIATLLMMTGVIMCVPTRTPMILKIKKGDATSTARVMGLMSTLAAVIELFVNPVLAKLSDQLGRKLFLTVPPLVNAFLHMMVAVFPGNLSVQFADRMISGSMIAAFMAPAHAALADLYGKTPQKFGAAASKLGTYVGIAAMLGPVIGARLGGAKSFAASALTFVAATLYVSSSLEETLPQEGRKNFKFSDVNPFAFVKLFQTGMLSKLTITGALQSFGDYVNIYDINNLFMIKVLGYGQAQIGNFATTVGVSQILGGMGSAMVIKSIGLKTTTLFSNIMWAVGMLLMGSARNTAQAFTALVAFWTFGHQRATSVNSYLQKYGAEQGMGRAEIVGAQGNLIAYLKVMIPLFYSNLFAWATSGGRDMPGAPFAVIAALTAVSQMTFWAAAPQD
eukprot:CAMPEP_0204567334 /NCGR_PEP_ID=MMETSP0661-20131031/36543_1 /ASSEMBLY_ACC=CAM_ASM_000606 /TAXON_ID=109239 /ORGANISM="Alexandrium margalefi, Strain AMGDE01CS-322" /LENGTH=428 /DNA_ID=CAMNT_0051575241 /DNA_START=36 /DNA_END=1322 /DNA_ORIENTATION=+